MKHQTIIYEKWKALSHSQLIRVCENEFLIHLKF